MQDDAPGIIDNKTRNRFELYAENDVAFIDYVVKDGGKTLDLVHTFVPEHMRGKTHAHDLVHGTLEHIRDKGLRFVPSCPFVGLYLRKHPEYKDLFLPS